MTDTARLKPDTRAAAWMVVSVFLASWMPLVVALVGGTVGPFIFQFWFSLTMCLVWLVHLYRTHPDLVRRKDIWTWILRQFWTRNGIPATLNGFSWALFVWATLFLDTALVTVITAGWPILFVLYQRQHDGSRYRRMTAKYWLLMSTAMLGVALVTLSQVGGVTTGWGWQLMWGLLLAAMSVVCASWMSFRFRLGKDLYVRKVRSTTETSDGPKDEQACIQAVSIVTSTPSILGSLLVGLTVFPSDAGTGAYLGGVVSVAIAWVVGLGIVIGLGDIAFRYANLETTNLGVNSMQHLQPVLSLVWLGRSLR